MVTKLNKSVLIILGVISILLGLLFLTLRFDIITGFLEAIVQSNMNTLHFAEEYSIGMLFVGFISIWSAIHYKNSYAVHFSMVVYWGLMALIHWFNVTGPNESLVAPFVISLPFITLFTCFLLRSQFEQT